MMLEDESGRLRVTGEALNAHYVTGCVLAALGTEQADGTFQVIATQYADLPRQPQRWERDDSELAVSKNKLPKPKRETSGKLAIVSGLDITGKVDDELALDLLLEYLTGEIGGSPDQSKATKISRLIIAGDSLSHSSPILSREDFALKKSAKKGYGYDASAYNASPTERLDMLLSQLLPTLPVTLLPGASDPANVALPQQPLHPALFPESRQYANPPVKSNESREGLDSVTNPWEGDIEGWRLLGTGGQTVEDLLKYVDGVETLEVMEMMLRWRCIAPTAPDTLCTYPSCSCLHGDGFANCGNRVLSLPRRGSTRCTGLSAYLLCGKPTQVRVEDHSGAGGSAGVADIGAEIQFDEDGCASRSRDDECRAGRVQNRTDCDAVRFAVEVEFGSLEKDS
jgi:DNA polymerase delta subunit 2